jgi:YVTN family beta-propeller protein
VLLAVPCSEADTVALFDAATGAEAGRVPVGSHPVHLTAADGRVLVATMGERSIDVITDGTTERVPTGVLGPSHFAITDRRAFVPCTGGDAVAVVDLGTLELDDRIAVGAEPHDAELVDGAVYVGSRGDGTVSVIDADSAAVRRTIHACDDESGTQPRIQGITAADSGVYAVDQANARVLLLDDRGVVASASVGADPYEPVVADDRLLVPGRDDGTVTSLSTDLSTATTHTVGGRPVDLVVFDGTVWVVDRDRPILRSLAEGEIELPYPGFAVAADPDQPSRVYVSHYDDDAVSAVDLDLGTVEWTAATPARPFEPLLV